jgi:predicted thioredoxin/glutaredoxin
MKEIEALYKKTLKSVRQKEKELEEEKQLLESIENKLKTYLQEHKGKLFKLIDRIVPFETALFWKKNFPKIHSECSVTVKTKKFDINLVKKYYPNKFKKCSKMTEQIIVEK